MPIMVITKPGNRHIIELAGWTQPIVEAVAIMYESDGYAVTTRVV